MLETDWMELTCVFDSVCQKEQPGVAKRQLYPMFNGFWTARLPSCLFPTFTSFGISVIKSRPYQQYLFHTCLANGLPCREMSRHPFPLNSWIFNPFISLFYMNFLKHLLWSIFWNQLRYEEGERLRKSEMDKLIYLAFEHTKIRSLFSVYRLLRTKYTNWYIIKLLQLKFHNAYSSTKTAVRSRRSIMEPFDMKQNR